LRENPKLGSGYFDEDYTNQRQIYFTFTTQEQGCDSTNAKEVGEHPF
jgi:hypothetical protein